MKTRINKLFLPSAVIASLGLILAGRAAAQTFATLHSFSAPNNLINSDGSEPYVGLVSSGNILYGTANIGGNAGAGTVFAVNTDGTGFTNLHSFTALPPYPGPYDNGDGANPYAGLILSNNTLYGTAIYGGSSGNGTVFALKADGTGFTNLHSFTGSDGANPVAGLILSDSTLYGVALQGGGSGQGTVFAVNTNGTGFTNLHSFTVSVYDSSGVLTNGDGANPVGGLILSGNTLYGTASGGGSSGQGTVFAINTDGTGFRSLHSFTAGGNNSLGFYTNNDGANPSAGLVLSGSTLYGTTYYGGSSGNGTVFAINTGGAGFTNLHTFNYGSDGAALHAGLVLSGSTLYGTAHEGGSSGYGTMFAVNTDGTGFTNLHSFTALSNSTNNDGAYPYGGLIMSGNALFGTASKGGSSGNGTVFSLSLGGVVSAPQLTITFSGTNVVLTWPASTAVFTLQSTTNLAAPVWTTVTPGSVVVNGQNTVSNPVSGTQQFYRLSLF